MRQTLARIGSGAFALGSLAWLLWPDSLGRFLDPEPLLAFLAGVATWLATEFHNSEEMEKAPAATNDILLGRKLVEHHQEDFRYLLKSWDTFAFLNETVYDRAFAFLDDWSREKSLFLDEELNRLFEDFMSEFRDFLHFVGMKTAPHRIGGSEVRGFKPTEVVSEEEYDRRKTQSEHANALAYKAWEKLDALVKRTRDKIPETLVD